MESHGETSKLSEASGSGAQKGPNKDKIRAILSRTGYSLDVTTGLRKYGGPPPNWKGPPPASGCEVYVGKIPRDVFEDELIPVLEEYGRIWAIRLMMDPQSGENRGYAFGTFCDPDAAERCACELNGFEIRVGRRICVTVNYHRLLVGKIPKTLDKEELYQEFSKHTQSNGDQYGREVAGLTEVTVCSSPDGKEKNKGSCLLDYESHKAASLAKRRLGSDGFKIWTRDITVDWAEPADRPDQETKSNYSVFYISDKEGQLHKCEIPKSFGDKRFNKK